MYDKYINEISSTLSNFPIETPISSKYSAIFDLDECCLSSYHFHSSGALNRFSSFEDVVNIFTKFDSPPIRPVLDFYNKLLNLNYNIFLITGRPCSAPLKNRTKENLERAGYSKYENIFFLPNDCSYSLVAFFKKATRDMLSAQGFKIVYNIGDQKSDFLGSSATHNILLPNPFY